MGKKNRKKKTTWRRLSLTDDKVNDSKLINDSNQSSHDEPTYNRDKEKNNSKFGSNQTAPRRTPSSPNCGTPPYVRCARGWNTRDSYYGKPFVVPCPSNDNPPDEYVTSFPEECNYNEDQLPEDENAYVSENQEIPYQQYVYQAPLTPIIPMIIQPPYHPLQWCDDPRLPPDVQYYVCFTQPFPQSHFTPLQPSPPTSPTSGPESEDTPSSNGEDASSERLTPGRLDEASNPTDDGSTFQPFITFHQPPPYIIPNTFAFKPQSYDNTTNGCYWWNDYGFVRGFKRRRRRFFVGGEGITYDRWPSRKDRIAAATVEQNKPQQSLPNSKDVSVEVNMSDDQIPAVHRHVSEQASPCPSAPLNHHTIETFDRHECERHSSQDTTTISATNQDAPSDCDTQTEALSSFDSLNEASIKEPQVDTLPKTVEASQVTSQEDLGTSAPCTEETATTEELLHTSLKENTEKKINTTSECQKQEGQVSEPDSEKVSSVDDTDKFDLTEPKITTMNNEGIINPAFTLQEETHINASQCDSQTDELLSLDNTQDTDIAPDTNHSVCSHSSNTEPLVINEDETSIDDQMMAQNSQTYLLESDNPFQSSSPFMEESKACSSSATNINFTPLDRQLYERLEDPATCSKYYQICTDEDDTLEDEVKFKPTETSTENSSVAILPAGEIVVHEAADSASECGSEDVEMIGHRYETANERQYKTNTISLAAELLGTNQQLPYDKEFKPLAQEGPFNVCYTNTHVLEGFYGRLNRQGRGWRRDVADSGIHTDESGDETEQRRRSQGLEDDEVLFTRNQRGTNAFQYQPFGRRPRGEYPPMLYLRSKGPWQGCCCSLM